MYSRYRVDEQSDDGKCSDQFGVYPACFRVCVGLSPVGEIGAVETACGDCEDELEGAEREADDHVGGVSKVGVLED